MHSRLLLPMIAVSTLAALIAFATPPAEVAVPPAPTVEEARERARLLHEAMHSTLQVVHHTYYREDEGLVIPAASLDRVFREVERRRGVKLRWLAVNAQAMNDDHKPQGEFEQKAVEALTAGQDEYEEVKEGIYRHVGTITLSSDCLKCHAPTRTSNKDRAAALIISLPVKKS